MDHEDILYYRMLNQGILSSGSTRPNECVAKLGAIQAQDYPAALWAIALRSNDGTTKTDVEKEIANGKIIRNWLMRGTLHFSSQSDTRWMFNMLAPKLSKIALLRDRNLGLTNDVIERTKSLFYKALKGGKQLPRKEMYSIMEKGGVPIKNNLGYHMLYRAAWDGLICFGPYKGKDPTFTLFDDWVPKAKPLTREESLARFALRYFTGHGPATMQDYIWWSGLGVTEARIGIEKSLSKLKKAVIKDKTYYMPNRMPKRKSIQSVQLLPAFDEYLISYKDRQIALSRPETRRVLANGNATFVHSNGIFLPIMVIDGYVVGTWKKVKGKAKTAITLAPFGKLSSGHLSRIADAAKKYGIFLGVDISVKNK